MSRNRDLGWLGGRGGTRRRAVLLMMRTRYCPDQAQDDQYRKQSTNLWRPLSLTCLRCSSHLTARRNHDVDNSYLPPDFETLVGVGEPESSDRPTILGPLASVTVALFLCSVTGSVWRVDAPPAGVEQESVPATIAATVTVMRQGRHRLPSCWCQPTASHQNHDDAPPLSAVRVSMAMPHKTGVAKAGRITPTRLMGSCEKAK